MKVAQRFKRENAFFTKMGNQGKIFFISAEGFLFDFSWNLEGVG